MKDRENKQVGPNRNAVFQTHCFLHDLVRSRVSTLTKMIIVKLLGYWSSPYLVMISCFFQNSAFSGLRYRFF